MTLNFTCTLASVSSSLIQKRTKQQHLNHRFSATFRVLWLPEKISTINFFWEKFIFLQTVDLMLKFSKHRPSGPMLSISWNIFLSVCVSVCPFVCSLLRYRLTIFLPPLPEVGCPIFLEIRNPWGKVMERSGLTFEHFFWKWSKIAVQKKFFLQILPYKTWWKSRFPLD